MYSDLGGKEILRIVEYFYMCIPKTSPPKFFFFFYIPKYNCDVVLSVQYRQYFKTYNPLCFQVGHAQVQLMPH